MKEENRYDDMSDVPVEDAMTLQEHDFRYHDGHYREGDDCLFRERMASGDRSDAALNEANSIEAAAYYAKLNEIRTICDKFCENFDFMANARRRKKNGIEIRATKQAKNGDRWVMILTPPEFDDSQVDEGNARKVCGELGYKFKQMKVGFPHGNAGGKKMFAILMNNPNLVGAYNRGTHHGVREDLTVKRDKGGDEPMSDARKSEMLKRFGLKVENGQVKGRGGASSEGESAARKYLRLVDAGGTALKNRTNADIKRDRDEEAESRKQDRDAFLRELGIKVPQKD